MTGRLCTGLGRTPEEVGAIGWPETIDLLDYWRDSPPVHEVMRVVAVRLGAMSAPEIRAQEYATQEEIEALARSMEGMNAGT